MSRADVECIHVPTSVEVSQILADARLSASAWLVRQIAWCWGGCSVSMASPKFWSGGGHW